MVNDKLKLYGFNNLTKSLSFNIYDICYAKTEREQKDYIAYIDEQYNSERLTNILKDVTEMLGPPCSTSPSRTMTPRGQRHLSDLRRKYSPHQEFRPQPR